MTRRTERVSELLREEISVLVREELKDPRLGTGLVSVTEVQVSPDLRNATVFVSHLGDKSERPAVLASLQRAAHFLQGELLKRLDLRRIPELRFRFDPSIERGARLTALINTVQGTARLGSAGRVKRQVGGPEGILLVDKPAGWTSHDVVAKVRRLAGQRRIGHTGTLDPAATGLLVLCLGRATRLVEYMTAHDKVYEGVVQLGVRTATDDAEGDVLETRPVVLPDEAAIARLRASFGGTISQVPPAFSAVKVDGQKAYDAARRGNALALAARQVRIDGLEISPEGTDRLRLRIECSAGTYIRSLARDIGEALGCGAHLASLRRVRAGGVDVADAWPLDDLVEALPVLGAERVLLPVDAGIEDMAAALVTTGDPHQLVNEGPGEGVTTRLYGEGGDFLGIGAVGPGRAMRPLKLFIPPA